MCVVELGLNVEPTEKANSWLIDYESEDFDEYDWYGRNATLVS